ncbi:Heme O synthase [Balamuthia mandrillaris]
MGLLQTLKDYYELSNPHLTGSVVLTAAGGRLLAASNSSSLLSELLQGEFWIVCAGTWLTSCSASCLNRILEVENDRAMVRTCGRALPSGRISPAHAACFSLATAVAGFGMLYRVQPVSAVLAAANIFIYAGIYTPMKQRAPSSTWWGAIVGAIPPLIGWTSHPSYSSSPSSSTSLAPSLPQNNLPASAFILPTLMYLWQIPHTMAVCVKNLEDYHRGHFQVLPVQQDARAAADIALGFTVAMCFPLSWSLELVRPVAVPFLVGAHVALLGFAQRFRREPTERRTAKQFFVATIAYVPFVICAMFLGGKQFVKPASQV